MALSCLARNIQNPWHLQRGWFEFEASSSEGGSGSLMAQQERERFVDKQQLDQKVDDLVAQKKLTEEAANAWRKKIENLAKDGLNESEIKRLEIQLETVNDLAELKNDISSGIAPQFLRSWEGGQPGDRYNESTIGKLSTGDELLVDFYTDLDALGAPAELAFNADNVLAPNVQTITVVKQNGQRIEAHRGTYKTANGIRTGFLDSKDKPVVIYGNKTNPERGDRIIINKIEEEQLERTEAIPHSPKNPVENPYSYQLRARNTLNENTPGVPPNAAVETTSPSFISLPSALLNQDTRYANAGEGSSWEEIQTMKEKGEGGKKTYEGVVSINEIYNKMHVSSQVDRRHTWETMKVLKSTNLSRKEDGFDQVNGYWATTITLDSVVTAAYGKEAAMNGEELLAKCRQGDETAIEVYNAAKLILENVGEMEKRVPDSDPLKDVPQNLQGAATYTNKYLFARYKKGPAMQPSTLGQWLTKASRSLGGKEEIVVTEDNWMDFVANRQKVGDAKTNEARLLRTEALPLMSADEAFHQLMDEVKTDEEYLQKLNYYKEAGRLALAGILILNGAKTGMFTALDAKRATSEIPDITDLTQIPSKEQVLAIQYGMSFEASRSYKAPSRGGDQLSTMSGYGYGSTSGTVGGPLEVGAGAGLQTTLDKNKRVSFRAGGSAFMNGNGDSTTRGELGISGEMNLGKNDQTTLELNNQVDLDPFDGMSGVEVGANLKGRLSKKLDWKLGARARMQANLTEGTPLNAGVGLSAGVERNMDAVLEAKMNAFYKENADAITTFKENLKADITNNSAFDEDQKKVLLATADNYVDMLVERCVLKGWTKIPVKWLGVGVEAVAGTGGVGLGAYLTFGIGYRRVSMLVPPKGSKQTEWAPNPGDETATVIPVEEFLALEQVEYSQIQKMKAQLNMAQASRVNELQEHGIQLAQMPDGTGYQEITWPHFSGEAHIHVAPGSDLEFLVKINADGPGKAYLNIDQLGSLEIATRTLEKQNGTQHMEIFISSNPLDSKQLDGLAQTPYIETIMKEGDIVQASKPAGDSDRLWIFGTDSNGNSTPRPIPRYKPARDYIKTLASKDLNLRVKNAQLFDEYRNVEGKNLYQVAVKVGENLATMFDYDDLAINNESTLNALITTLYQDSEILGADALTPEQVTDDLILMARQKAMEINRPGHKGGMPLQWNQEAWKATVDPLKGTTNAELYNQYLEAHKDEIKLASDQGTVFGEPFPDGAELQIFINHEGTRTPLLGYYDKELHGRIHGAIEWDPQNPEKTLTALGLDPNNPTAQEQVKAVETTIARMRWSGSPNQLHENASLREASDTIEGELLLEAARTENLYGPGAYAKLQRLLTGAPIEDTEIGAHFIQNVKELQNTGHTWVNGVPVERRTQVYTGVYDKCFNLAVARSYSLAFAKGGTVNVSTRVQEFTATEAKKELRSETLSSRVKVGMNLPIPEKNPNPDKKYPKIDRPQPHLPPQESEQGTGNETGPSLPGTQAPDSGRPGEEGGDFGNNSNS